VQESSFAPQPNDPDTGEEVLEVIMPPAPEDTIASQGVLMVVVGPGGAGYHYSSILYP
jgi:hypothetical protein